MKRAPLTRELVAEHWRRGDPRLHLGPALLGQRAVGERGQVAQVRLAWLIPGVSHRCSPTTKDARACLGIPVTALAAIQTIIPPPL